MKNISNHFNSLNISSEKSNIHSTASYFVNEYLVMILIAVSVVVITSGSHSIGLPFYIINPMHWVIYCAILFRKTSVSSIVVLAFALPLTSMLLTGHPLVFKCMIMGVELSIYGIMYISTIKYFKIAPVLAFAISQVTGRIVYYGLKYILIQAELIDSALLSTSILIQFIISVLLGLTLYLITIKKRAS